MSERRPSVELRPRERILALLDRLRAVADRELAAYDPRTMPVRRGQRDALKPGQTQANEILTSEIADKVNLDAGRTALLEYSGDLVRIFDGLPTDQQDAAYAVLFRVIDGVRLIAKSLDPIDAIGRADARQAAWARAALSADDHLVFAVFDKLKEHDGKLPTAKVLIKRLAEAGINKSADQVYRLRKKYLRRK